MNRKEVKSFLHILQAFADGKEIECREEDKWYKVLEICNEMNPQDYRIKPEPKYRPFKDAEECWKEMQKHQPFGWVKRFGNYTQIITLDNNTITLSNSIGKSLFLFYKDYKQITFADGSVFGVKVED